MTDVVPVSVLYIQVEFYAGNTKVSLSETKNNQSLLK